MISWRKPVTMEKRWEGKVGEMRQPHSGCLTSASGATSANLLDYISKVPYVQGEARTSSNMARSNMTNQDLLFN